MRNKPERPPIETAPKRARLPLQKNPYWVPVVGARGGLTLGYRKRANGPGSWIAKVVFRNKRFEQRIGTADDKGASDEALDFAAATAKSLAWAKQQAGQVDAEIEQGAERATPTIADVVKRYIADRKKRSDSDARTTLSKHVLRNEAFASTKLSKLTANTILGWREGLAGLAPASQNRLLNDLRAALNAGAERHRRVLPADITAEIKVGTRANKHSTIARKQILEPAQVQAVIAAAFKVDEDFGRLVLLAAATGARYSQLARLNVGDLQLGAAPRVMVPRSRKGASEKSAHREAVPIGLDVADALALVATGRAAADPLLMRWEVRQTGPFEWIRTERVPWKDMAQTRLWRRAAEAAALPADVVMYSLRHTSIVRMLSNGLPIRLVAALHDTSTLQIEKHYAAFITSVSDDLVRRTLAPLISASAMVDAA